MTDTLTKPGFERWPAVRSWDAWRFGMRAQRWTLLITGTMLGAVWAAGSGLRVATERTLLVVITTIALSTVLADDAAAMTAASPTPLLARRLVRAAIAGVATGLLWLAISVTVIPIRPDVVESAPWWAIGLEWCAIASSQLALGSVRADGDASAGSIWPGLFVGLMWITAASGLSGLGDRLYPVADHPWAWVLIVGASALTFVAASHDPARRRRLRRLGPPRPEEEGFPCGH